MRITTPSFGTVADWTVLLSFTSGIAAARMLRWFDTRILANLLITGLIQWTIRIRTALWSRFRYCLQKKNNYIN